MSAFDRFRTFVRLRIGMPWGDCDAVQFSSGPRLEAFIGEVGVIVLGVLIALGAQQAAESVNERRGRSPTQSDRKQPSRHRP